jgi:hypothetical protein
MSSNDKKITSPKKAIASTAKKTIIDEDNVKDENGTSAVIKDEIPTSLLCIVEQPFIEDVKSSGSITVEGQKEELSNRASGKNVETMDVVRLKSTSCRKRVRFSLLNKIYNFFVVVLSTFN